MKQLLFNLNEKLNYFKYLRDLKIDENLHLSRSTYVKIFSFFEKGYENGETFRDKFGNNQILLSMQTILMASKEIGIKGDIVIAYFLRLLTNKETDAFIKEVKNNFSEDIIRYVYFFQKVNNLLHKRSQIIDSENFKNLFVSLSGDMRVILLLIIECVILMRLIRDVENKEEQKRISKEAAFLYAPLAHKLGLYTIKSELEDLSLKYLEKEAYYLIKEKLNATKKARDAYIETFIAPLRSKLEEEGIKCHIKGRTKSIHSIWQKMKKQKCNFEGVYDLFAIRVIINAKKEEEKSLCWKVFSLITYKYESNLKRLRDWLSVPKPNGYESLHITVLGPQEKWVEVQIRSERMDEVAEHGFAAHWRYKGIESNQGLDDWLGAIRNSLEQGDEKTLARNLSSNKIDDKVYIFSPKGDLYKLPKNSTVLDFAYHIHSALGNKCTGGKIGEKNVSFKHVLESGQTVEILTSNSQSPKSEWINWVVSSHAKAKIRAAVKELNFSAVLIVKEQLERKLKNRKIEWDQSAWNQLIKKKGYKEANNFYQEISENQQDINNIIEEYIEVYFHLNKSPEKVVNRSAQEYSIEQHIKEKQENLDTDVLIIDKNIKGVDFKMAKCCNPVYGDQVFGFISINGGIKIHRKVCPNAPEMRTRFPYRIIKACWSGQSKGTYSIVLRIIGQDDIAIINNINSIISKEENVVLRNLNIDSNDGLFTGIFTLLVTNTDVLNALLKKIKTIRGVKAVSRA